MPVEINELVIRAVVERQDDDCAAATASEDGPAGRNQDAMIDECVKAVLKVLRRSKER